MQKAAGGPESVGKCAAVTLLDWYYLDQVLILVMERPDPCMDLKDYIDEKGGSLEEHEAKVGYQSWVVDIFLHLCVGSHFLGSDGSLSKQFSMLWEFKVLFISKTIIV